MVKIALTDFDIAHYTAIASLLATKYFPFYTNLAEAYSDASRGMGKVVRDEIGKIQKTLPFLARITGRGLTPITKRELESLNKVVSEISETQKKVAQLAKMDTTLSDEIRQVAEETGVSQKDLSFSTDMAKKSRDTRRREGFVSRRLGEVGGEVRRIGLFRGALYYGVIPPIGRIGRELIQAVMGTLGPLLPLVTAAGALGAGGFLGLRGLWRAGQRRWGEQPLPEIGGMAPSMAAPGAGLGGVAPVPMAAPVPAMMTRADIGAWPRDVGGRFLPRGRKELMMASEPIFYFFHRRAYRARWTRDLMRYVKQIARGGGIGGIAGVGGVRKPSMLETVAGWEILKKAGGWLKGVLGFGAGAGLGGVKPSPWYFTLIRRLGTIWALGQIGAHAPLPPDEIRRIEEVKGWRGWLLRMFPGFFGPGRRPGEERPSTPPYFGFEGLFKKSLGLSPEDALRIVEKKIALEPKLDRFMRVGADGRVTGIFDKRAVRTIPLASIPPAKELRETYTAEELRELIRELKGALSTTNEELLGRIEKAISGLEEILKEKEPISKSVPIPLENQYGAYNPVSPPLDNMNRIADAADVMIG